MVQLIFTYESALSVLMFWVWESLIMASRNSLRYFAMAASKIRLRALVQ